MKGQRAHPGQDAIAACMGDVRTWRSRRVVAHIAACPSCSAVGRQLRQVTAVLAAVPPPALPADVARRLDAVLAAEVAARAVSESAPNGSVPAGTAPAGTAPAGTAAPAGQRRGWLTSPHWRVQGPVPVLAALAVCLVLGGGGYLISQATGTGAVKTGSASRGVGTRPSNMPAISRPEHVGPVSLYQIRSTNTDYLATTLRAQAVAERSSQGRSTAYPPATLGGCVMVVAGNDTVLVVDLARFQGKPAIIIVAANHAWVTGRGCTATQHEVLDSVSLPPPTS